MGNFSSSPSDDYPLEPRRLDKVFEDVVHHPPRRVLRAVDANKVALPGRTTKLERLPQATLLPPTPTPKQLLDACCDLAEMITPGITRSALKDEASRRRALNILRGEAVQTAVAEALAKQAACTDTRGSDLKALKQLQKQAHAIAESSTLSLERAAAELSEIHTRQIRRVRAKSQKRVTIAEPIASEQYDTAHQTAGSERLITSGDCSYGSSAHTSALDVHEVSTPATGASHAPRASHSSTSGLQSNEPQSSSSRSSLGERLSVCAPQPLQRPRSTPEPSPRVVDGAESESVEGGALGVPLAEHLDSPEAVLAYLAHRRAQLDEQKAAAAHAHTNTAVLEHKSSPPSEDDLSPPHGELSRGESPAAPTTVQVAAWRAVPIVASRIKDLTSAAFLSDDDSDHFSRLSTDSASSPSETSSDVDAAASWRAADAKEEEHAALVGALRQQIAQLTASLEEERAAKERMLHAKVVCPHCESIF